MQARNQWALICVGTMLFGGAVGAQVSSNVTAVQASNSNVTEILVTASPITAYETVREDGGSVSVVGRKQIERLDARELSTALRSVPGVTISRLDPLGAYGGAEGGSIYIRGEGAGRPGSEIKIYSDGIPRESGAWAHPLLDMTPVDFADSISVSKGPQPQAYAGTFGAVDIQSLRRKTP
ncbi:MAG: Plug domain-containing protein, partial [Verrucomicrobia bacterium]|nr:Plug domain-containing protein [Verrucomicrobiota bacterium]